MKNPFKYFGGNPEKNKTKERDKNNIDDLHLKVLDPTTEEGKEGIDRLIKYFGSNNPEKKEKEPENKPEEEKYLTKGEQIGWIEKINSRIENIKKNNIVSINGSLYELLGSEDEIKKTREELSKNDGSCQLADKYYLLVDGKVYGKNLSEMLSKEELTKWVDEEYKDKIISLDINKDSIDKYQI